MTLPMLPNGLSLTVALPAQMASADAVDAVQMVEIESLQTLPEAAAAETASDVYSRPAVASTEEGLFPLQAETMPDRGAVPAGVVDALEGLLESDAVAKPVQSMPVSPQGDSDAPKQTAEMKIDLTLVAAWLWLGVSAVIFAVRLGRGLVLNTRLSRMGMPLTDPELCALCDRLSIKLALRTSPQVRVCPGLGSPLVFGFRRQTVLLPEGIDDPAAFAGVVAHEMTHIRRYDLWLKLVTLVALSLHWFNPLAYLAARRFEEETELSCDEAVLRDCDEDARRGYGYVLLSILRRNSQPQDGKTAGLTTQFQPGKRAVRARFEGILDASPKKVGWAWIALILAVCVTMGTLAACSVGMGGDEKTTGPGTIADVPAEQPVVALSFTPVTADLAELSPFGGQDAVYARDDGGLSVVNSDGTRTIWTRVAAVAVTGEAEHDSWLAVFEESGSQVMLTRRGEEYLIVDHLSGVTDLHITQEEISGQHVLRVEYARDGQQMIAFYFWTDGSLMHWFEVAIDVEGTNAFMVVDLDGDGDDEYVSSGDSWQTELFLYAVRGGQLCCARVNEAAAQVFDDEPDNCPVTYADGAFTFKHILFDTETHCTATYRDGAMLIGELKPVSVPSDQTEPATQADETTAQPVETTAPVSASAPSLTGTVYFRSANSSFDGPTDLLLCLTADRLYYAFYFENGRIYEETGLTSIFESGFYCWQTVGVSIGAHYYGWNGEQGAFIGDSWGDFCWGDRLVPITEAEYNELYQLCAQHLERQKTDISPQNTIRLSTPLRNGDEERDMLRIRIVNGSDQAISLSTAYTLQRRDDNYTWQDVACNGTPAFPATRYTVAAGSEAVLDFDLSVYTALLESSAYYRAVVPVRLSDGSEIALTCTFRGNGVGVVSYNAEDGWYYIACNSFPADTLTGFTLPMTYAGGRFKPSANDYPDAPWQYIEFNADSVTLYLPLSLFGSHDEVAALAKTAALALRIGGTAMRIGIPTIRYSESLALVRYPLIDPLACTEGMQAELQFDVNSRT